MRTHPTASQKHNVQVDLSREEARALRDHLALSLSTGWVDPRLGRAFTQLDKAVQVPNAPRPA